MSEITAAERSTEHATFEIERTFPHEPQNVFAAFADLGVKSLWFGDAEAVNNGNQTLDFRVGGAEKLHMSLPSGTPMTYDARYIDIVPDVRAVYAYDMTMNGERISATIAAVELTPVDGGTQLKLTEHGIFFDGLDTSAQREHGTELLIERLGAALDEGAAA
jgi:uncharacterized protein YndB with AHSA1/START domain